jgi:hypothetical protein
MSTRLTCPGCGRSLFLPDDCTAELLSCPRCLAHIPNPQAGDTPAAVQTTPSPPPTPPATGVQRGPRRLRSPDVDVDVRRDSRGTSVLMIVLAVFGGLGVSYALLVGFAIAAEDRAVEPLLILLGVLAVITVISGLLVFARRPSPTMGANIGRTILGALSITGAVVLVGFLLMVALFIFALVVCLANGGKC